MLHSPITELVSDDASEASVQRIERQNGLSESFCQKNKKEREGNLKIRDSIPLRRLEKMHQKCQGRLNMVQCN
jgi:hypothetical protein